jgi:hypothetical protein
MYLKIKLNEKMKIKIPEFPEFLDIEFSKKLLLCFFSDLQKTSY